MMSSTLAQRIGSVVINKAGHTKTPVMAAAAWHAMRARIPLVDFVVDVRDARLPLSSESHILNTSLTSRRIIVFNKLDLAVPSLIKEWMTHFESRNFATCGVNSHNKQSIQQGQVRSLRKTDRERNTITMMLCGIPNVGKSALANALHQIGRISAAEKGKLKHAVVSPFPGETKSISSLKIASHPSIYILDTPGLLPPKMSDCNVYAKLALTGAIGDSLVGEKLLAQLFLSILNLSNEHHKWEKLSTFKEAPLVKDDITDKPVSNKTQTKDFSTDHTKDSVVLSVRSRLAEAISSFKGNLHEEKDMMRLIEVEFLSLREAFNVHKGSDEDIDHKVAVKLLNLYRTGRLGQYILDNL
ncbi:DAR GTPase 2, mitochondrial isoform X2 [Silene latifolia]|uniref:DAR GTPase 2, mitochondrial isoform X2 n=1 Tax=Silene latifolia TaxID=37657 RepID=UPI003D7750EE